MENEYVNDARDERKLGSPRTIQKPRFVHIMNKTKSRLKVYISAAEGDLFTFHISELEVMRRLNEVDEINQKLFRISAFQNPLKVISLIPTTGVKLLQGVGFVSAGTPRSRLWMPCIHSPGSRAASDS